MYTLKKYDQCGVIARRRIGLFRPFSINGRSQGSGHGGTSIHHLNGLSAADICVCVVVMGGAALSGRKKTWRSGGDGVINH